MKHFYIPSDLHCEPLTSTRALADFPVANRRLRDWQNERLASLGSHEVAQPHDADFFLQEGAWISLADMKLAFTRRQALVSPKGELIAAWVWNDGCLHGDLMQGDAFETRDSFAVRFPWDLLRVNEEIVGNLSEDRIDGEIHPLAVVEGRLHLGKGSRLLPGVFIEGNVVIGEGCKIGPNCYLRGSTSIGDKCHVGNAVEIKNSILLNGTSVGHLTYLGDSILGAKVNFGAGTITSNLRHDGGNHRSLVKHELVDTGRRKLGVIIGDGVHTGINTSFYPGRKMAAKSSTLPGEVVRKDVPPPAG
jgi:UDP-N-acetylglucosamine diphosphorylase / glucose-1-phosphate thymidylyltransferase / UDP-N-acetylgalactosamine diphosphorylase / glucosamine-1-phosphate N-acetyltransferase / galactosamine-1-phosphate N-acetyltransferase